MNFTRTNITNSFHLELTFAFHVNLTLHFRSICNRIRILYIDSALTKSEDPKSFSSKLLHSITEKKQKRIIHIRIHKSSSLIHQNISRKRPQTQRISLIHQNACIKGITKRRAASRKHQFQKQLTHACKKQQTTQQKKLVEGELEEAYRIDSCFCPASKPVSFALIHD